MTTRLPPMRISQGSSFPYDVTVTGQDWTGWTGTATFKTKPKAMYRRAYEWPLGDTQEPILTVAVTADATGLIQMGLTAAQTALLPALPVLGYRKTCVCEISMTDGTDVQKFQANVSVSASL